MTADKGTRKFGVLRLFETYLNADINADTCCMMK